MDNPLNFDVALIFSHQCVHLIHVEVFTIHVTTFQSN